MEEDFPHKMTEKDKIPKKKAASGRSKTKVPKKNRKPPPEATAHKRNMSSDFGTDYNSDEDKGRDGILERAQE